ncbi:MAG: hypothetical protein QOJ16_4293 [Acidobacteriota bacterium]|jgi:hypothetical protein|nr:hypothetical protein [Acidobacteriota bacterium]
MKKQIVQKLALNRETLRVLLGREVEGVAGGLTIGCTTGGESAVGGTCIGCQHTNPALCN